MEEVLLDPFCYKCIKVASCSRLASFLKIGIVGFEFYGCFILIHWNRHRFQLFKFYLYLRFLHYLVPIFSPVLSVRSSALYAISLAFNPLDVFAFAKFGNSLIPVVSHLETCLFITVDELNLILRT